MKEKKIRANLKVSIKKRKRGPLKTSVKDFKQAKLEDYDGDVPVAEKLLKLAKAKDRKSWLILILLFLLILLLLLLSSLVASRHLGR